MKAKKRTQRRRTFVSDGGRLAKNIDLALEALGAAYVIVHGVWVGGPDDAAIKAVGDALNLTEFFLRESVGPARNAWFEKNVTANGDDISF